MFKKYPLPDRTFKVFDWQVWLFVGIERNFITQLTHACSPADGGVASHPGPSRCFTPLLVFTGDFQHPV